MASESDNYTTLTPTSGGAITDLWGRNWTLAGNRVLVDGVDYDPPNSANLLVFANNVVYERTITGAWQVWVAGPGQFLPDGGVLPWLPVTGDPRPGGVVTVTLHGPHRDYIIASNGGSLFVQDTVGGRDGTKTPPVDNLISFTDGTGVFDPTGTAEDVARIIWRPLVAVLMWPVSSPGPNITDLYSGPWSCTRCER